MVALGGTSRETRCRKRNIAPIPVRFYFETRKTLDLRAIEPLCFTTGAFFRELTWRCKASCFLKQFQLGCAFLGLFAETHAQPQETDGELLSFETLAQQSEETFDT
jgi:hypothetical protein